MLVEVDDCKGLQCFNKKCRAIELRNQNSATFFRGHYTAETSTLETP